MTETEQFLATIGPRIADAGIAVSRPGRDLAMLPGAGLWHDHDGNR
jgi:hypothetical protein